MLTGGAKVDAEEVLVDSIMVGVSADTCRNHYDDSWWSLVLVGALAERSILVWRRVCYRDRGLYDPHLLFGASPSRLGLSAAHFTEVLCLVLRHVLCLSIL